MASIIPLKQILSWDLNKSLYEEIDFFPLMQTPGPVLVITALYFLFVLKIGPNFMRKREAYKLTGVLLFNNAIQVLISMYLVKETFDHLSTMGLFPRKCYMKDSNHRNKLLFTTWLYWIAKLTELLDTVFFVLRKKNNQITFLHLYHHSSMVVCTWLLLKYWACENLMFIGFANSLIHVFMYTYYSVAALGPRFAKFLFWKKYMTKMQLVQFISIMVHYFISVQYSECPPPKDIAILVFCNTGFFLILFANFYLQSYKRNSEKKKELQDNVLYEKEICVKKIA